MSDTADSTTSGGSGSTGMRVLYAALPLAILALLAFAIVHYGKKGFGLAEVPPIEELTIQWITLRPGEIRLDIVNGGPHPVTIPQVLVDEAYWMFTMDPPNKTLERLQHGVIKIPYPWVKGETHEVRLISRNGVTFDAEISVALESPLPTWKMFGSFALLGLLIGVIPVGLGLLWYPLLGDLSDRWLRFLLWLTVGLLLFLGLDTMQEGLEMAEVLPGAYQGTSLLFGVALLVFMTLMALGGSKDSEGGAHAGRSPAMTLAWMIAFGIGLHNIGEGLAVGSAYVLGKVSVGTSLVLGFTLHNITEGLAIVVPAARERVGLKTLLGLGALAGLPTIAGTLIGGFTYSTFWALVFFAVAAGAIFQVVYVIVRSPTVRSKSGQLALPENLLGLVCGLAVMYGTGLLFKT